MRQRCLKFAAGALAMLLLLSGCSIEKVSTGELSTTEPETTVEDTTQPAPETTAEPEKETVSIIMVGDVLLHEKVAESGKRDDGTYNYDHFFANVKDEILGADIAIVNQEVILGGKELGLTGYPSFNGAFEVGDAEANVGFNVVLHATNHALDKGKTAVLNCIDFWKTKHPDIGMIGIYDSQESRDSIYVTEKNGIKVAILNYTYGTNGIPLPSDMPYAVNMLDETTVRSDVAKAKQMADFVIVAPHWGTEYTHDIVDYQKRWTDIFADCGVDLVIGTHPHVVEPVETVEKNGHSMLVYYSIGNFINSTAETGSGIADRMLGAMATVTIEKDENGGAVKISDYGVIPLVTHVKTGQAQTTTYKLSDYTQEMAAQNEIVASDPAFSLEYCKNICRNVFKNLYNEGE